MSRGLLCATLAAATRIRGVNLGGWLVLEPWILPTFFETANEGSHRKKRTRKLRKTQQGRETHKKQRR